MHLLEPTFVHDRLLVAGISCAAIFLLVLIGGILAVRNVKDQIDLLSKAVS